MASFLRGQPAGRRHLGVRRAVGRTTPSYCLHQAHLRLPDQSYARQLLLQRRRLLGFVLAAPPLILTDFDRDADGVMSYAVKNIFAPAMA